MWEKIADSELILNEDGSIYHLNLKPEELAENIFLVGDPERVKRVSNYFDSVEIKKQNREFITHTGYLNNKRLSVISTGIGCSNIDIVLNEVDALFNIDLEERRVKEQLKSLNFYRLGTCGSFHPEVEIDSIVISKIGIGLDGLMRFYEVEEDAEITFLLSKVKAHFRKYSIDTLPYAARVDEELIRYFEDLDNYLGITLTLNGFYGPQGRQMRLLNKITEYDEVIQSFEFEKQNIWNLEMETAAIYAISNALGHKAISVSAVVANRSKKQFSKDHYKTVETMISEYVEQVSLRV